MSNERMYLESDRTLGIKRTDQDKANVRRHLARYNFASKHVFGDVLDCACGSGYGSEILSNIWAVKSVTGIDRSRNAIYFAVRHHLNSKTLFLKRDITKLDTDKKFNSVVCLETFEHLPYIEGLTLLYKIKEIIPIGGVAVLSSPMLRYRDGKPYCPNPFHLNELPKEELIRVMSEAFGYEKLSFYAQHEEKFLPLTNENEGFCIIVYQNQ